MIHWQNLNDAPIKKYWLHARMWIGRLSICWCFPTEHIMISFGINGGDSNDELTFSFGCGLFALWLSLKFHSFTVGHWSEYTDKKFFINEEREFDLYYFNRALWIRLWGDPMGGWSRDMSWHLTSHCFRFDDFLFGKQIYSEKDITSGEIFIPMPEGCYKANFRQYIGIWKRTRLPFKTQRMMFTIDIPKGIPHEGKGENSWDCGEDGTYGLTAQSLTVEKAIGEVVSCVLKSRKRYGHSHIHRNRQVAIA